MQKQLIILEGIIGVGKTTISNELAKKYHWQQIPEVIGHTKFQKYTESYYTYSEELKIKKYSNTTAKIIVMDRSPISIMAHNYIRKKNEQKNSYIKLKDWFNRFIEPIKKQRFIYLRTNNIQACIERKWGRNLQNFPSELTSIPGAILWTKKKNLQAFQNYYDKQFKNNKFNNIIIDSNTPINKIIRQIKNFIKY